MINFKKKSTRQPDFNNLITVLYKQPPSRPTLFEFFLNDALYSELAGEDINKQPDNLSKLRIVINAYANAGYDFSLVLPWLTDTFEFRKGELEEKNTRSLNEGNPITDIQSFEEYQWPDPSIGNYDIYKDLEPFVPEGMKLIVCGPSGVLENAIDLMGFERLCMMTLENPELTKLVFDAVGSRLLKYYQICSDYESVGALIVNDDWGFNSQTILPPETLREHVFPWHKKIVSAIHDKQKPAILHSCGNLNGVMDDVILDMEFDGKHSFEDEIVPVEEAYTRWGKDIAILGGVDMDYLTRKSKEEIMNRCQNLLEMTRSGGYALGSGNSIPDFIPKENYYAMISVVNKEL